MVAGPPLPQGDNSVRRLAEALESLDADAKRTVALAHGEAFRYASDVISSAHLLLGLMAVDPAPVTAEMPGHEQLLSERIRIQLELYMGAWGQSPARIVHLAYTPHARAILINAAAHAQQVQSASTTPAHLWLALRTAEGCLATRTLKALHLLGAQPS
ncbi:hypothetical protein ACQ856_24150 [Mycolicibacterium psychrotolerans]|uniref:hypothetical protein n=1 Tax=Mycolicibacterium psychrotolerans TaxID=216929 RepID=UPI003D6660F1